MSELPISCFRCRRRKIKCNKRKPCNQCSKHNVPCQFPSKFRNVSFDEGPEAPKSTSSASDLAEQTKQASPANVSELEQQVRRLEMENQYIREQFQRKLRSVEESDSEHSQTGPFQIRGETTEKGEKYYGPLLSNNMTEDFDMITSSSSGLDTGSALKHHLWTSDPFKIAESDNELEASSEGCFRQCAVKQPLPWVVGPRERPETNVRAIKRLVRSFFDIKTYDYFISEGNVLQFIDGHACAPDMSWENSDDLLLLHMVLLLAVQRLSPTQYNELGHPQVSGFQQLWRAVRPLEKRLFRGFSKLRHNLMNESYVTVQAYILCTEWEFIMQRYEELWLMMFHCCLIAYALGLHVVSKSSSLLFDSLLQDSPESLRGGSEHLGLRSKDGYDDYFVDELPKLRVWFALRNLNAQMCLILGRPNPIMIQVNHVLLPVASISNVEDAHALNALTNTLLKLGLSECVRLSNSNMIESFLTKISMDNVWEINLQFSDEIDKLSYYLSLQYESLIDSVVKKIDPLTDMPTTITRKDVLTDLIVLHVNRVKLLEPFVDQLPPNKDALNFIMGSILLFFEHTCELVSEFVKKEIPRILNANEAAEGEIRLDKVFVFRDPFFASFIYQGIVVTFILISIKANDFIQEHNGNFITQVEGQIHMLLGLHSSISKLVQENIHLWSRSNIILMRKILENIGIMKQAFKDYNAGGHVPKQFNGFDFDPQIAEMLGNNLRDPFWIVNPENSTNFLGISEDIDDDLSSVVHKNGTNGMTSNPQTSKFRVSSCPFGDTGLKMQSMQAPAGCGHMPLFSDQIMQNAEAQYGQIQAEGNFASAIDIDADGTSNLHNSQNPDML